MSVKVKGLTKVFGKQKAVDDISFEAVAGEILGFLGPNGAGKSTTMKIATGYLPPSEGAIEVCGFDVAGQSIDARKNLGYLPEHNPLYLDMYVHEYLRFIGTLHGMKGEQLKARVKEMVVLCGLTVEQNKKIGTLSKGYRQRVGLAQALIHDPKVLILDEPTTGLDPNQILEIRNLIRKISVEKTVIFSTHIMQEVQALCSRVIIIDKGQIVADNSPELLLQQGAAGGMTIIVEFADEVDMKSLQLIPDVFSVSRVGFGKYHIQVENARDIRAEVFNFAVNNNLTLLELRTDVNSLESIFQSLTQSQ